MQGTYSELTWKLAKKTHSSSFSKRFELPRRTKPAPPGAGTSRFS